MPQSFGAKRHLAVWPALVIVLLDQISKLAVVHILQPHESVPVVTGLFNLVHVRNSGMAFGLMNRSHIHFGPYFLLAASLVAVVLLLFWLSRLKEEDSRTVVGLSLVLGGAIGNLIDRIRLGEVIDFLDFYLGSYHWPAFNVSDSAITAGTFLVLVSLLSRQKKATEMT